MGYYKEKMIRDMKIRGLSERTIEAYLMCMSQLIKYYMKPPDKISLEEINAFQYHVKTVRKISDNYYNLFVHSFRFFFSVCLAKDWDFLHVIPNTRRPKFLPIVMSHDEVQLMYDTAGCQKHKLIIMTLYSTGIRAFELCNLKVEDIDSTRMVIHIHRGKGIKDRMVNLNPILLKHLRDYYRENKAKLVHWLFPSRDITKPYGRQCLGKIIKKIREKAGIKKKVTTHSFRHTFATHSLEAGEDIKKIQLLLGHSAIRTTDMYFHVSKAHLQNCTNLLSNLSL